MTDLILHGRRLETVFELLGDAEDDITYSVGWGLAQSENFTRALLSEVYGPGAEQGELAAVRLQQSEPDTGRTDIEIETGLLHLVIEAKRGWQLPGYEQLLQYAGRLSAGDRRQGRILVVAECTPDFPPVAALPEAIEGIPVSYLPWSRVAGLADQIAVASTRQAEARLLRELHRYLRRLTTVQNTTSNLVYVVTLQDQPLDWSDITFKDMVYRRNCYFHPVGGGKGGWPKTPANYLGFRFGGRLQRVHHVEGYEVITRPHEYVPEIHEDVEWDPTFTYFLGPAVEPATKIPAGNLWASGRVWAALDLLLTAETIAQARDITRERHKAAGIPFP